MTPTILHYPAPARVYDAAELAEVFGKVGRSDPIALALRQVLQARVAAATGDATDHTLTERAAGHVGGRLHELLEIQSEIFGYIDTAATAPGPRKRPAAAGKPA